MKIEPIIRDLTLGVRKSSCEKIIPETADK